MALDALILIAPPVWGFRPFRALRRIFENVPNPKAPFPLLSDPRLHQFILTDRFDLC
jgi:hypothetical protein